MEFKPSLCDEATLLSYISLFSKCFPDAKHYTLDYLKWLYCENPCGTVLGYDAIEDEQLVAHYACIPVKLQLNQNNEKGLLSLNTATLPSFQGKGLFTKLAKLTYDDATKANFSCVYGVANANSTPGFLKKLGFQLVTPLDAKVGIGNYNLNIKILENAVQFRRIWTSTSLEWRAKNPVNPIEYIRYKGGINALTLTDKPLISAFSPVFIANEKNLSLASVKKYKLRLFLGKSPKSMSQFSTYIRIPNILKPSPLNLIYKPLSSKIKKINEDEVLLGFLDFDAY